jgi:hypothetical protein
LASKKYSNKKSAATVSRAPIHHSRLLITEDWKENHWTRVYPDKEEYKKEFAVWENYYHFLEEKCLAVDTWNRLKWLEYYNNPPVTLESQPCKLVTWKCPNSPCRDVFDDKRNVQKICQYCREFPLPPLQWSVTNNPTVMYLMLGFLPRNQMVIGCRARPGCVSISKIMMHLSGKDNGRSGIC